MTTPEKTLGQIGYEALQDSRHPVNRTAWTHPAVADARPAWETAMQAVAAHAAGTTAEDDGAAEITRLRGALEPLHALGMKWDATAARNQRNGQSLLDQGDEYGSEGLAIAEALGACVVDLRAVLADYETDTPAELYRDEITRVQAELENQVARGDRLEGRNEDLRSLLGDIGVMAANAPEDGDSFGLLEQIAMRVAAVDVPDTTPIDEWPDPSGSGFAFLGTTADLDGEAPQPAPVKQQALSDYLRERGRPGVADMIEQAELAAATGETQRVREVVIDMLMTFSATGSGHSARVGQVQIARWRKRAGLED